MTLQMIDDNVIRVALGAADGPSFEKFSNAIMTALHGSSYVPLGGVHDGGADGRLEQIYEDSKRSEHYFQASVTKDYERKIRKTIETLKKFGRTPQVLTYVTSQVIRTPDVLERKIATELNVTVIIKDGQWALLQVNTSVQTLHAFDQYLGHYVNYLSSGNASRLFSPSKYVKSPSVFVFLANEIARREGKETLVDSVTDALILRALEGTDPDQNVFRSEKEIAERIDVELPSVSALVQPRVTARLSYLAKVRATDSGGRRVQWHKMHDGYCLPFETRQSILQENAADEALVLGVVQSLEDRVREASESELSDTLVETVGQVVLRTLQLAFEKEGAEFVLFIRNKVNGSFPTIYDFLRESLVELKITGTKGIQVGEFAFAALRGVFYDSREVERVYLQRLSRTYALLFTLNTEPHLLDFFQTMTSEFRLYVGTDQIIKALSEYYLAEADQITRNNLLFTVRSGAKLILTEPVLREVVNHLRSSDREYTSRIAQVEQYLTWEIIRNVPPIMLRACLYARHNPDVNKRRTESWESFVGKFCTYKTLRRDDAFSDIRQFLQVKFGFEYETYDQLRELVDSEAVSSLATKIAPDKTEGELADNDALLAHAVYGKRQKLRETSTISEFGWGTWWLTEETRIMRSTRDLVKQHNAEYIMRPAFLLNFLTLMPSTLQVRKDFATIFPSMLGIRLANRLDLDAFNAIMDQLGEAETMDEARRFVEIGKMTNKLKSDFALNFVADRSSHQRMGVDMVAARDFGI